MLSYSASGCTDIRSTNNFSQRGTPFCLQTHLKYFFYFLEKKSSVLSDFFPLLTAINSGMQSAWSLQTQWATGHCTWTGVLPSIQSTISHDFIVSLLLHFVNWSVPFAIVLPQFRNARQQTAGFLIFQVNFPYSIDSTPPQTALFNFSFMFTPMFSCNKLTPSMISEPNLSLRETSVTC